MPSTKANAQAVAELTHNAWVDLLRAESALTEALGFAKRDYQNNADALQAIVGGLRLVNSAVCGEMHTWNTLAAARDV